MILSSFKVYLQSAAVILLVEGMSVRFLGEGMKKSLLPAIELLAMAIVLAIGTTSTAIVYAASNSDDNPGNGDTQPDSAESN